MTLSNNPDNNYKRDLSDIDELDRIINLGVDLSLFPELQHAHSEYSEVSNRVRYLEEQIKSVEGELNRRPLPIGEEEVKRIFEQRTKPIIEKLGEEIQELTTKISLDKNSIDDCNKKLSDLGDFREEARKVYYKKKELEKELRFIEKAKDEKCREWVEISERTPNYRDVEEAERRYFSEIEERKENIKSELRKSQDKRCEKKEIAVTLFSTLRDELFNEEIRTSMTVDRRKTFISIKSVPDWGDPHPKHIIREHQKILAKYDINELYHFTHIENLISIRTDGLLSYDYLTEKGIEVRVSLADESSRYQDTINRTSDYIHVSFVNSEEFPMYHLAKKEFGKKNIAVLKISPDVLFYMSVRFTQINAASSSFRAKPKNGIRNFKELRFDLFNKNFLDLNEEEKKQFQAEVLVPRSIPKDFIINWDDMEEYLNTKYKKD